MDRLPLDDVGATFPPAWSVVIAFGLPVVVGLVIVAVRVFYG